MSRERASRPVEGRGSSTGRRSRVRSRRDDEIAISSSFHGHGWNSSDLRGHLFAEQPPSHRRSTLKEYLQTFVVDEVRHAEAASASRGFYDPHHLQDLRAQRELVKFRPHFLADIKYLSDDPSRTRTSRAAS